MKVTGTATPSADGKLAGDVRIGARGERRHFLVADVNPLNGFLSAYLVDYPIERIADYSIDSLNPGRGQSLNQAFCYCDMIGSSYFRIESPVQGLMRTVKKDTEIGDTKIPAGSVLIVHYGAANRDADKFSCPAKFDIARHNPAPHMSFGWGAHLCVGASLARQEIATAFNLILDRLDNIELARSLTDPPLRTG
jgi:hypothetical protein